MKSEAIRRANEKRYGKRETIDPDLYLRLRKGFQHSKIFHIEPISVEQSEESTNKVVGTFFPSMKDENSKGSTNEDDARDSNSIGRKIEKDIKYSNNEGDVKGGSASSQNKKESKKIGLRTGYDCYRFLCNIL